jgi:hypothetical protein
MNTEEAMQHGLGYASGREDASGVRTAEVPGDVHQRSGFIAFAEAYAKGWDRFNRQILWCMVNAQAAYDAWQESGGRSIYRLEHESESFLRALAGDGDEQAAHELNNRALRAIAASPLNVRREDT